jgi:hypothetical protein
MILNARQSDTQAEVDDHLAALSAKRKLSRNALLGRPHVASGPNTLSYAPLVRATRLES